VTGVIHGGGSIALGIIGKHPSTKKAAKNLRDKLPKGAPQSRVSVSKKMFLEAANPDRLLALANMEVNDFKNWQRNILILSAEKWGPHGPAIRTQETVQIARDNALPYINHACGYEVS